MTAIDTPPNDFRLTVTIRNGRLLRAMEENGLSTAADLSRVSGVHGTLIGLLLNLKIAPITPSTGKFRKWVIHIANTLKRLPEDLFPPKFLHRYLVNNSISRDVSAQDIRALQTTPEQAAITDDMISGVKRIITKTLSPSQQRVIQGRFYDGLTLEDIAQQTGVTRERIRQIELAALHRLSHPKHKPMLHSALQVLGDTSDV